MSTFRRQNDSYEQRSGSGWRGRSLEVRPRSIGRQMMTAYENELKCVGSYSEDEGRRYRNDNSALKFIKKEYVPNQGQTIVVDFDLTTAMEKAAPYSPPPFQEFYNLLNWIKDHNSIYRKEVADKSGIKLVCRNKLLSSLTAAASDNRRPLTFLAIRVKDTVFIKIVRENNYDNSSGNAMGHKFEQFMVGDNVASAVAPNVDFRCVLASDFGHFRMIMVTSVDSFLASSFCDPISKLDSCVQFNSMFHEPSIPIPDHIMRMKKIFWASKSILCGIGKFVIGHRNKQNEVYKLTSYVRNDFNSVGFEKNFNYVFEVLKLVAGETSRSPGTVFEFHKAERSHVFAWNEKSSTDFFPAWFDPHQY